MNLIDKTILVTGSSSGIGQAVAISLAKQGAKVLIHFNKNIDGANETLNKVCEFSSGKIYQADLTKSSEISTMFQAIKRDIFNIDCVVNNAGDALPGDLDNFESWEYQLNNILMSQVKVTAEFLKQNSDANLRKIINISSIYGISDMENPEFIQYSAAKSAVLSFTKSLAKKYAPSVLVNAIAPGYVSTPPWKKVSTESLKEYENRTKILRFIKPEEIASAVVFLLENDAITGEVLRVDGGLHLHSSI